MAYSKQTKILHINNDREQESFSPEVTPIYHSTAYIAENTLDYDWAQTGGTYCYNRSGNPNRDEVASSISLLECAEESLVCASGMAAISTTLLSVLKSGDHIIFNQEIYAETIELANEILLPFNIDISYVDFTSIQEVEEAIQENTRVLYTEVVSNPYTHIVDLYAISQVAKMANALLIVDNTFTTPFIVKPLCHGADIVLHSLTKYFGGHSDVTGGSISGSKELIKNIKRKYLLMGSGLDANSCWLIQRSLVTMQMRVKAQFNNAQQVAEFLAQQTCIQKVYYPGLDTHPQHQLAVRTMEGKYGAIISFKVEDSIEKVDKFIEELNIIKYLGTLGGVRTSLAHPATAFKNEFTQKQLDNMGLFDGLIRLSIGIEEPQDIIDDLSNALEIFK